MKLSPEFIDAMVENGCSVNELAAVVKASLKADAEARAAKREMSRKRKRRQRERERQKSNEINDHVPRDMRDMRDIGQKQASENENLNEINDPVTHVPRDMRDIPILPFPSPLQKKGLPPAPPSKENTPPSPNPSNPNCIGPTDLVPKRVRHTYSVDFEEFWTGWRDVKGGGGKYQAFRSWKRLRPEERGLAKSAGAPYFRKWRSEHDDCAPLHAATFLNQKRFLDHDDGEQERENATIFIGSSDPLVPKLMEYFEVRGIDPPDECADPPGRYFPASLVSRVRGMTV